MRQKDYILLATIVLVALLAVWVDWGDNPGIHFEIGDLKVHRDIRVLLGLDLGGGTEVVLEAIEVAGEITQTTIAPGTLACPPFLAGMLGPFLPAGTQDTLGVAQSIIERRVDALGVTEPRIHRVGEKRILVELPGIQDPALAVRTIRETGFMEFIDAGSLPIPVGTVVVTSLGGSRELTGTAPLTTTPTVAPTAVVTPTVTPAISVTPQATPTVIPTVSVTPPATAPVIPTVSVTPPATAPVIPTVSVTPTVTATLPPTVSVTPPATPTVIPTVVVTPTPPPVTLETPTPIPGTVPTTTGPVTTPVKVYQTIMTGRDLKAAYPVIDQNPSSDYYQKPVISLEFTEEGGKKFAAYTSANVGKYLAIVIDKRVISSPVINEPIPGGRATISGRFTFDEARSLAAQLQYGALPIPFRVISERVVDPILGQDSIQKSILAGLVGVFMVLLFMAVYYRVPGLVADIALIIFALATFALFKLIPVALTLPGIAGFLISTGMAVDANILIFERMKEELRAGRTLGAAIEAGFDRAWTSIRDSNISTLITCAILFWFGSTLGAGAVMGFAVTLFLGVVVSMFTAITVTHTLLRVLFFVARDFLQGRPRLLGI